MSLIDEIKIKSFSDAQEILKAAGTEDILDFEKAHKDGDLHPNGKWVWVSSANGGRGDWRTLNGRTHKKHQAANAAGGNGVVSGSAASTTTGGKSPSVKTTSSKSKKSSSVKIDMDTIDQDEYNRIYKQAKSVDKQGRSMALSVITSNINKIKKNLEETISNRPGAKATIKSLQDNLTKFISQKKAVEDAIGEIDNNSKTTSSTNSLKSPSKVFKKISAKNLDELYTKTLSYIGGRIRGKINNNLVEGTIRNSKKKDDRVVLTVKKDDGSLMMISTSIRGIAKYQAPQPDASKIKEIKEGKKEVKISSAMGATDWSTLNYLINSGIEIQYQHGLSFRGGSNSSKKIDAEEVLEKIHKNTTFDASVDGGVLYIHTYSGFDMD